MKYILPIGAIAVAILLLVLWAAGAFSSPATSVIPVTSSAPTSTPMPSPISLITSTPIVTATPATTPTSTPTIVLTWTITPTVTPSPSPVVTIMPTLIPGGGGGGGGGSLPIVTLSPTPAPMPTPSPTPRLPANPLRNLPSTVMRGQSLDVSISFIAPYNEFHAIGMEDTSPTNWIVQVDEEQCVPIPDFSDVKGETAKYIWFGPYAKGIEFTVIYDVSVPEDVLPGIYTFTGKIGYYIAGVGTYFEDISGDQQVIVVSP